MEGASLWSAHLEGAYLGWTNMEGADLSGAHLEGADLSWASLWGAELREINPTGIIGFTHEQAVTAFGDASVVM
jgi:uncharacterized protein YjbI with pentapeptide repeats